MQPTPASRRALSRLLRAMFGPAVAAQTAQDLASAALRVGSREYARAMAAAQREYDAWVAASAPTAKTRLSAGVFLLRADGTARPRRGGRARTIARAA